MYESHLFDGPADGPDTGILRAAFQQPLLFWSIRLLCGDGGMQPIWQSLTSTGTAGAVEAFMGLTGLQPSEVLDTPQRLRAWLEGIRAEMGETPPAPSDCAVTRNLAWRSECAGLNHAERQVLLFAFACRCFTQLRQTTMSRPGLSRYELPQALGAILGADDYAVQQALGMGSRLRKSGLVNSEAHREGVLDQLLHMSHTLANSIAMHGGEPNHLMDHLCAPIQAPKLKLQDYPHMATHTALAKSWLQGVDCATGAHLLVNGAPGLGKTEWVRALMAEAERVVDARELTLQQADNEMMTGYERVEHLRLCMHLLAGNPRSVIVFDEADDAFEKAEGHSSGHGQGLSMANHRAGINHLMETSPVPVIWIMNRPEIMDPAVLRRFDAIISFEPIPRSLRLHLLQSRFADIDSSELNRWADVEGLTAALIDRLATIADRLKARGRVISVEQCRLWIAQRVDERAAKLLSKPVSALQWNPDLIHASVDLEKLIGGIGSTGSARILLYGPPGTGKTEFAKALARRLDVALLERRPSDLLSAWVGETEQRIEQAFTQARSENAVLFIDEVDSLLSQRDNAHRSWEVTMVNELLVQLGEFEGVVVLATNRLDSLDRAVLRRMDAKVAFGAMTTHQVRLAFTTLVNELKLPAPTPGQWQDLVRLSGLNVGDFAAARASKAFQRSSDQVLRVGSAQPMPQT